MKKILIVAFLLYVSSICLFGQSQKKLAMVSFTGDNITASEAQSLMNMFSSELTRSEYSKELSLLTRNEATLRTVYSELKFQREAMLSENQMSRVGQQLGADWLFYGTVTDFGGANVTINILDVEAARIVASVSVRISSVYDLNAREMTRELIAKTRGMAFVSSVQQVQNEQEQQDLLKYYNTVRWVGRGLWISGVLVTGLGFLFLSVDEGFSSNVTACFIVGGAAIAAGVPVDVIYTKKYNTLKSEIKYSFVPYIVPETDINGQFNGNLDMGAKFMFSYQF